MGLCSFGSSLMRFDTSVSHVLQHACACTGTGLEMCLIKVQQLVACGSDDQVRSCLMHTD